MPIVRLPNGDLRDEIRQPLYDTLTLADASIAADIPVGIVGNSANSLNNQQFFSDIQGKAKWQTNLRQNSLLEVAVSFRVQGMSLDAIFQNISYADPKPGLLPSIMDFGSLRLHIGEKDYWEGPLVYLMGRLEQNASITNNFAVVPAVTDTTRGIVNQRAGQTAVQGVILSGRHVIDINPLQSFYAKMQMNVPSIMNTRWEIEPPVGPLFLTNVLNLKLSLKGLQRRPVQ